jgi:hypothetical protein
MLNLLREKFIQSDETYDQNNLPVQKEMMLFKQLRIINQKDNPHLDHTIDSPGTPNYFLMIKL